MIKIDKKIFELRAGERIDILEVKKKEEVVYYSYNYKIQKDGEWILYIRWDNFQNQPHVDKYDENGNHIETTSSREKNLKQVIEVVDIFGRNLISMDLSRV